MRVLVADHRHVVVAVDAGRVERARDRLPEVHVGGRRDAVGRRDLVGVVARREAGGPPTIPPAWALPCSGSLLRPPRSKLTSCRFQAVSVKPSLYDQSCMRLCIANRFAIAASMSLRCAVEVNFVGLHALPRTTGSSTGRRSPASARTSRSSALRCTGRCESHFSVERALLPLRRGGRLAGAASMSHAQRRRRFATARSQPGAPAVPAPQLTRVGRRVVHRRVAGNASQVGLSARGRRCPRARAPRRCGVDEAVDPAAPRPGCRSAPPRTRRGCRSRASARRRRAPAPDP